MVQNTTRGFGSPLRYIQGQNEFDNLPIYTNIYGDNILFLIDGYLFDDISDRLVKLYDSKQKIINIKFNGEVCKEEIDRIADLVIKEKVNLLVGIGGGKTLDTVKLAADDTNKPIIICPTSASNDAPASEIAIYYTKDGEYLGSKKMKRNSDLVLVDSNIILKAPKRLFVAGIGDALATWFEARANNNSDSPNYITSGLRRCIASMAIAKSCYDTILKYSKKALLALDSGCITDDVENIIEANILLSGLGFQNTGCSTAHGIHSGLTCIPSSHKYLHGEKVAFGIVVQMILEDTDFEELDKVMKFMVDVGLPVTLEQVGVEPTKENISKIAYKTTMENKLIYSEPFLITENIVNNAITLANELGKKYLNGEF